GKLVSRNPLPDRGHGFANAAYADWLVAFARRPGNFAVGFHKQNRTEPLLFHAPAGRHFYGHGAFSGDGRLLYAAENAFETGDGVIGIYDATGGFARIGEFPSHGVGPHEIVMMPDGKTLCIANGGIKTHPDFGRQKLNLATMKPSVAFVNAGDGALVSAHRLPPSLHRLSLRHMAVDGSRRVWIGGQYEGDVMDEAPVLARLDSDNGLVTIDLPDDIGALLGKYVGSVAIGEDGRTLAFTSPKAGAIVTLDTQTAKPLGIETVPGTCGVQADAGGFITSSETGRFAGSVHDCAWDNHITLFT
ncbi:MAG: DUF1513 domain-containing protein, partial [Rhizobiaceae bacterium]|nr:DUF1513 domain-containing protein [Rhizobiaceae bacterium]